MLNKLIVNFYPYYAFFTYFLLIVEVYTYENSISKFIFFGARDYAYFLIFLNFYILLLKIFKFIDKKISIISDFLNSFFKLSLIPLLFLYFIIVLLEENNFPNYIFDSYHLNIENCLFLLSINATLVIMNSEWSIKFIKSMLFKIQNKINSSNKIDKIILFFKIIFIYLLFGLIVPIFSNLVSSIYHETIINTFIINVPFSERLCVRLGGKKCNESFGWIQTYGNFIKKYSKNESTIFIPPQKESWEMTGNLDFIRYFIYPRKPISNQNLKSKIPSEAEYVLISYGEWYSLVHTWPQIIIPKEKIKKIVIIDRYSLEEIEITNSDYIPNFEKEIWGIIELNK